MASINIDQYIAKVPRRTLDASWSACSPSSSITVQINQTLVTPVNLPNVGLGWSRSILETPRYLRAALVNQSR